MVKDRSLECLVLFEHENRETEEMKSCEVEGKIKVRQQKFNLPALFSRSFSLEAIQAESGVWLCCQGNHHEIVQEPPTTN